MIRQSVIWSVLILTLISLLGCSSGAGSPISSGLNDEISMTGNAHAAKLQTQLWGYYNVTIDPVSMTVSAVQNRHVDFTANVVNFLNKNPLNLGFKINKASPGADYTDIDIDVTIKHPFPGMPQYNGYDVRGVFMGDGSSSLSNGLLYPVLGTDQYMLPDTEDGFGGPDGYTRWYNITEFSGGGMPLFNYTPGKFASKDFAGTATLCPYKYFADGLGATDNVWTWLNAHAGQHGVFSSGASNKRNYYLRFPVTKSIRYGYAVIANWSGVEPEKHPSNAPEAVGCHVVDTSNVFYVDPTQNGGNMKLAISVFDWGTHELSMGFMDDYRITIESTVLSIPYEFDSSDMTPVGGDENFSTYHVEIPADNVDSVDGNEYWIMVEYPDFNYGNGLGVPNDAQDQPLTAYFRYGLDVSDTVDNTPPDCDVVCVTPMPFNDWANYIAFDASGSTDIDGDTLSYEWDFNDDGIFGDAYEKGTPNKPMKYWVGIYVGDVCVRVSDGNGGVTECCVPVDINAHQTKNINVTNPGGAAVDLAIDHLTGDVMVFYANKNVRRYKYSQWFESYTSKNVSIGPSYEARYIDFNQNGFWNASQFMLEGTIRRFRKAIYNSSDIFVTSNETSVSGTGVVSADFVDVVFMGNSGNQANDVMTCYGTENFNGDISTVIRRESDSNWINGTSYTYNQKTSDPQYKLDRLWYYNVVGAEADIKGDWVWFVEKGDCVATRWGVSTSGSWDPLVYAGPYFGTSGTAMDGDGGLNDPKDIASDNEAHMYVLDELSTGDFTIKAFTYDASSTTPLGHFDYYWIYDPFRIDGSMHDGKIVVLMTDGTNSAISMFIEDETP